MLVPAIEIALFSGTKPLLNDATNFQKFLAYIGCGWYSIEDLTLFEIRALPDYVQDLIPIQDMLSNYSYSLDDLTKNCWIMVALGLAVRLLTLAALFIKVYGRPIGSYFACIKCGKKAVTKQDASPPTNAV